MSESPIEQLMRAIDNLDVDGVGALLAPDARFLTVDGATATGKAAARDLIEGFFSNLRSADHQIKQQWHQDGVWIAEIEATYELQDWLRLNALPRAVVLRESDQGITELHVYGAHERPLTEHGTQQWVPPL